MCDREGGQILGGALHRGTECHEPVVKVVCGIVVVFVVAQSDDRVALAGVWSVEVFVVTGSHDLVALGVCGSAEESMVTGSH